MYPLVYFTKDGGVRSTHSQGPLSLKAYEDQQRNLLLLVVSVSTRQGALGNPHRYQSIGFDTLLGGFMSTRWNMVHASWRNRCHDIPPDLGFDEQLKSDAFKEKPDAQLGSFIHNVDQLVCEVREKRNGRSFPDAFRRVLRSRNFRLNGSNDHYELGQKSLLLETAYFSRWPDERLNLVSVAAHTPEHVQAIDLIVSDGGQRLVEASNTILEAPNPLDERPHISAYFHEGNPTNPESLGLTPLDLSRLGEADRHFTRDYIDQ